jgi:hypothetical protein
MLANPMAFCMAEDASPVQDICSLATTSSTNSLWKTQPEISCNVHQDRQRSCLTLATWWSNVEQRQLQQEISHSSTFHHCPLACTLNNHNRSMFACASFSDFLTHTMVVCIRKSETTENTTGEAKDLARSGVIQDCSLAKRQVSTPASCTLSCLLLPPSKSKIKGQMKQRQGIANRNDASAERSCPVRSCCARWSAVVSGWSSSSFQKRACLFGDDRATDTIWVDCCDRR